MKLRQVPGLKRLGLVLACILAAVGLAYLIFKLEMPPSGYIEVNYDGMSRTVVFWRLENHSTQAIYVYGSGNRLSPTWAVIKCRPADYSAEVSDRNPTFSGFATVTKIPPGGQIRLEIESSFPEEYKGGYCRLRLTLAGGTFVESHEFTPK
jgi:hypothetical protein